MVDDRLNLLSGLEETFGIDIGDDDAKGMGLMNGGDDNDFGNRVSVEIEKVVDYLAGRSGVEV